ncbi:MAG TPA: NAD(+) diphosphatase [Pseudonocardiaceae bacterium]
MSATPFRLLGSPVLSRGTVRRFENAALDDPAWRSTMWSSGRVLPIDQFGAAPVRSEPFALAYRSAAEMSGPGADTDPHVVPERAVLVGEQDGVGYWALPVLRENASKPDWRRAWSGVAASDQEQWVDLRGVGAQLDATDAGVFTSASALLNWHRTARFCARCGAPTRFERGGWASRCTGCAREEFPRTDPAVICLVHDEDGVNGEQVLLGHQPSWPAHRFSVLAGFVEAGESLEDCVRREIAEEVGAEVREVRYLGNQPWPFPRSLMIGFAAVADRSAPLKLADGEIEEARWFSRAEVRAALTPGDVGGELRLPGEVSIAGQMLAGWAASE